MPRNTRNVWLSASIDGRSTELEGGPASRDGGLLDLITGGQSDTSARIREVVGVRHDAMQHDDCKACGTSWGGGS